MDDREWKKEGYERLNRTIEKTVLFRERYLEGETIDPAEFALLVRELELIDLDYGGPDGIAVKDTLENARCILGLLRGKNGAQQETLKSVPRGEALNRIRQMNDEREVEEWKRSWYKPGPENAAVRTASLRMGRYNGQELAWRVLDRKGDVVYCLCETGLRSDTFMDENNFVDGFSWRESQIREWLNRVFLYEAFTEAERERIVPSFTERDYEFHEATFDRVFLPAVSDVSLLMPTEAERKLSGTPDDVSVTRAPGLTGDETGDWWWLRSGGLERDFFCCVDPDGKIDRTGRWGLSDMCAIRPGMLVRMTENDKAAAPETEE